VIGGFGKTIGAPPDVYHSYLGLAALSVMGQPDLKPIDPTACFSIDAAKHLASLAWRKAIWDEEMTEIRK
jgi:geranylgeranyl transferase type-1 subunit beta